MTVTVVLADDHKILRQGLVSLLDEDDRFQVIGEASSGREALLLARQLDPDVVVMDVAMGTLNGIIATQEILREKPQTKIVALSMSSDRNTVVQMLEAGADAYVVKDSAYDELALAIVSAVGGKKFLSAAISGLVIEGFLHPKDFSHGSMKSVLTRREAQILQLLGEGYSAVEVGRLLHISRKTVYSHKESIKRKFGFESNRELLRYAYSSQSTDTEC